MKQRAPHLIWPFLLSAAVWAAGCATVTPPPDVSEPVLVYIADYGRHSSLLLPQGGEYTEYAFGHWEWFARGHDDPLRGPLVLLVPGQGTLGRRPLGPIRDAQEAAALAGALEARGLIVDADRAGALAHELDARFDAALATRRAGPDGMDFVKDPRPYHGLANSNTLTAAWLRRLGATVDGPALLSGFRIAAAAPAARAPASPPPRSAPGASPPSGPPAPAPSAG